MKVGPYKVKWEHHKVCEWVEDGEITQTVCVIVDESFVVPAVVGVGCCAIHRQQPINEDVEKRIALGRALGQWGVNDEMWIQVWHAYEMRAKDGLS